MFTRVFFTQIKMAVRTRTFIFWTLIFPIALGTLFYFAFHSIYSDNQKETIPVVILKESEEESPFPSMAEKLAYDDGTPILAVTKTLDLTEAEKLLKDGDADGILKINGYDVQLEIAENGIQQSILTSIVTSWRSRIDTLMNVVTDSSMTPEELQNMEEIISHDIAYVRTSGLAGENKDPFVTYFYNLIAMVSLMGSLATLSAIVRTQGNQSGEGIRVDISPVNKPITELAILSAATLVQMVVMSIVLTYYIAVLGIRFGGSTGLIYMTSMLCVVLGMTLGFLIGHIGNFAEKTRENILMLITLGGGFMAGLMYGDMKVILEEKLPLFNRINPASVMTDAFYSLNVFGTGPRYTRSLIYLAALSLVFLFAGLALSRRKQYASL